MIARIPLAACLMGAVMVCRASTIMQEFIQQTQADFGSLDRFYTVQIAPERQERLLKYSQDRLKQLNKVAFDKLDRDGQVDWVLTRNWLEHRIETQKVQTKQTKEVMPLLDHAAKIIELAMNRQKMIGIPGEAAAKALDEITASIKKQREKLEKDPKADKTVAYRAAQANERLKNHLNEWYEFYKGYDPVFTWWCAKPYEGASKAVSEYTGFLREKLVGIKPDDQDAIVGHPVGREALMEQLQAEMIPYSPEELIEIAEKEYKWCETEMIKASREMGCGDDWRKALEKVKNDHVEPGKQPQLIRDLALEAIDYVKKNDFVTVPPLAEETWRMTMMSADRQKVSPFFLGGEQIMVSFPTDTMTYDQKLMSLRANNVHFARATVHHELIPGHHLQGFMEDRMKPYRAPFYTPFWTEGWALWFEFLFWDTGFPKTPENKIGMLFWRMHRCVRIVFSLSFHLGKMTPEQCIEQLVKRVGHEQSTAEGEVRRSFGGQYPPLYQAAYMLGALQFRALASECVGKGKMSYRQFHDAILAENNIPIEVLRAVLLKQPLTKDLRTSWRFAE